MDKQIPKIIICVFPVIHRGIWTELTGRKSRLAHTIPAFNKKISIYRGTKPRA